MKNPILKLLSLFLVTVLVVTAVFLRPNKQTRAEEITPAVPEEETNNSADVVNIPDAKFKALLNKAIDRSRAEDQAITKAELAGLTELDINQFNELLPAHDLRGTADFKFAISRGIKSIEGIQYAVNLERLLLSENEIADLTPLSQLQKLTFLELDRNRIVDVAPLANLTNLEHLKLYNNWIEDISPLAPLVNLKYLDVHYNVHVAGDETNPIVSDGLKDISVVSNFKELDTLDISANMIENIDVILDLPKLETFDASGNRIADFSKVADYLSNKFIAFLNEGVGSIQFFNQSVPSTANPLDITIGEELISPYKGTERISELLREAFAIEDPNFHIFQEVTTSVEGLTATYDPKRGTFKFKADEKVLQQLKKGNLTCNLTMRMDDLQMMITNVVIKGEELETEETTAKPTETKPTEVKPTEAKPTEAKPTTVKATVKNTDQPVVKPSEPSNNPNPTGKATAVSEPQISKQPIYVSKVSDNSQNMQAKVTATKTSDTTSVQKEKGKKTLPKTGESTNYLLVLTLLAGAAVAGKVVQKVKEN